MPEYQLQIKQVVDYPRCRIYREFIHKLINDRSIRINGGSGLFHFTVLCSYANFRTSYRRIDGISYTVSTGEWVCTVKELSCWFRTRFHRQALSMLDTLQKQHLISYTLLGRGNVVKYKILHWARHNSALEYNAPCQKDTGFFFPPVSVALELVSSARCSEMDIVLDLWVSAVYNDTQCRVRGRSGSLFSQWYRKPVGQLYRTLLPLGAVTRYRMPDTEKAGRSWVYLYHVVSRPAWKRDLPAELPVHHV